MGKEETLNTIATICRAYRVGLILLFLSAVVAAPRGLEAQLFQRSTVIENVTLLPSDSRSVENARIVIRGGQIVELGREASKPLLSRTIDGKGGTVTTGWIACSAQLALDRTRRASPHYHAWDGFDRYDRDAIDAAYAAGVTTVCLVPSGASGIMGTSTVVRLAPRESGGIGVPLAEETALCIDLGSSLPTLSRLKTLRTIEKQFQSALDYRESLDQYEEDLEKYLEELAKGDGDRGGESKSAEGKEGERRELKGAKRSGGGKSTSKKDSAKESPKKPKPPKVRPDLEVILKAIDRQIPVRIEAHHSADIFNAIALAKKHDLDWVLVGASEAHLVLDRLSEGDVTVLLETAPRGERAERAAPWRRSENLAAELDEAGISWQFGAGPVVQELLDEAGRVTRGSDRDVVQMLTRDANQFLRLSRRQGRLGRGAPADLVIWTGDPTTDPSARVDRVLIAGKTVFQSKIESSSSPASAEEEL